MEKIETYIRNCPKCNKSITHNTEESRNWAIKTNRPCRSCSQMGRKVSDESKKKMSLAKIGKPTWSSLHRKEFGKIQCGKNHPMYGKHHTDEFKSKQKNRMIGNVFSDITKKKLSDASKKAWNNPIIRKKYNDSLEKTKWLKVRTDKGQLELIEKWNKLGFNFETNYQIKTDKDLFYIDGYDKEKNVVLEYDSKYHSKPYQQKKDLVRQNKIIEILKPKKFWRYDKINEIFIECLSNYISKEPTTVVVEH
jgi:hypothetical protein